jgi:hypothetical protein
VGNGEALNIGRKCQVPTVGSQRRRPGPESVELSPTFRRTGDSPNASARVAFVRRTLNVVPADEDDRPRLVSGGHVARFQDDHRRLSRPLARIPVEPWIDRDPALPQPITLVARGRARAYQARKLVGQSNHGVWVCLQVEPPRGLALVPAVHSERDEVWAIFEVANDHAALFAGLPPDGRET